MVSKSAMLSVFRNYCTTVESALRPVVHLSKTVEPLNTFTFLTYNILSPHYLWPQVYTYVANEHKEWDFRFQLLQKEILHDYKADIMSFQEMEAHNFETFWKPTADRINYGAAIATKLAPKYWTKSEMEMDGVATFFNKEKFELVHQEPHYLKDIEPFSTRQELEYLGKLQITMTNGAGDVTGLQNALEILENRNQVSLFVVLRHKHSGEHVIVINTHLYWKYQDIQFFQCLLIMRQLRALIEKLVAEGEIPNSRPKILFSGDLNSVPKSTCIQFLKNGRAQVNGFTIDNPMKQYITKSVHQPICFYDSTCYSGKLQGLFDYIWFNESDFELRQVLSGLEVSHELNSTNQAGLPNEQHPSDHIPLLVEFELQKYN